MVRMYSIELRYEGREGVVSDELERIRKEAVAVNFMILLRYQHVRSSTTRTPGSWVRIPLEAWKCVRVFLCCGVLCVGNGLATG